MKYDICSIVPLTLDITVGPEVNTYTLGGLKAGTEYEVQISGFTRAGEGTPSRASLLTTTEHQGLYCTRFIAYRDRLYATHIDEAPFLQTGSSRVSALVLTAIAVVTVALIFGSQLVERYDTRQTRIPNVRCSKCVFIP